MLAGRTGGTAGAGDTGGAAGLGIVSVALVGSAVRGEGELDAPAVGVVARSVAGGGAPAGCAGREVGVVPAAAAGGSAGRGDAGDDGWGGATVDAGARGATGVGAGVAAGEVVDGVDANTGGVAAGTAGAVGTAAGAGRGVGVVGAAAA